MSELARSDYGQHVGQLYQAAGVSGPSEFGALPPADRRFWNEWFDERLARSDDALDDLSTLDTTLTNTP